MLIVLSLTLRLSVRGGLDVWSKDCNLQKKKKKKSSNTHLAEEFDINKGTLTVMYLCTAHFCSVIGLIYLS